MKQPPRSTGAEYASAVSFTFPLYPLLLGIYPVLFLWMANYIQLQGFVVGRSFLFALGITAAACLLSLAIFRDLRKAGLAAGLFLILFFSYGHFFNTVDNREILGFLFGRHRYTLPLWGAIFAACLLILFAAARIYPTITPVNTFRLIFSTYFHQDYSLLPDRSIEIGREYSGGYRVAPQTCVR